MESVGMTLFGGVYPARRVLVTGHTGFKGSWLATWLSRMGSEVTGLSLPADTSPNHWDLLHLPVANLVGDIRDIAAVQSAIRQSRPEIVFHLAAQPLVLQSYRAPLETWSTNVLGTANVLEACRSAPDLRAIVIVTTDKVYANIQTPRGYIEEDRLGGHDPYSASKAASELVVESYRKSYFFEDDAPLIATARAGNVIGGGDWSEDRLIPDVMRALSRGCSLEVRSPNSTRSWQHVLECVAGYLLLGQKLFSGHRDLAEAWNFGPGPEDNCSVASVLTRFQEYWPQVQWHHAEVPKHHEAELLSLDSRKARSRLGWKPVWNLETALLKTADWYRQLAETDRILTHEQLTSYEVSAAQSGCVWAAR